MVQAKLSESRNNKMSKRFQFKSNATGGSVMNSARLNDVDDNSDDQNEDSDCSSLCGMFADEQKAKHVCNSLRSKDSKPETGSKSTYTPTPHFANQR